MKRLLLAILLTAGVSNADAETFKTPAGATIRTRGGCMFMQVRVGRAPVQRDEAWCDQMANTPPVETLFKWVPDFIMLAFDNAERAVCDGQIDCVVDGRDVQIILVAGGIPNAMIAGGPDQLTIFVSANLIDIAEAAEVAYYDEMKAVLVGGKPHGGFTDWITEFGSYAGKSCRWHLPTTVRKLLDSEFLNIRGMAQMFLELVMAHELAHVRSPNANCWSGSNPSDMERELACDKYAFTKLASATPARTAPLMIVPVFVAMSHYEHLLDRRLGRMFAPSAGMSFLDLYQASNWTGRATRLITLWEDHCTRVGARSSADITCRVGWKEMVQEARRLNALPLPGKCTDNPSSNEDAPAGPTKTRPAVAPFCAGLVELITARASGFVNIRGVEDEPIDGSRNWASTIGVPDRGTCTVWSSTESGPSVRCALGVETDVHKADAALSGFSRQVADCLGGTWQATTRRFGTRTKFKTIRFTSPTTTAAVELTRAQSQTQSRLSLEVE